MSLPAQHFQTKAVSPFTEGERALIEALAEHAPLDDAAAKHGFTKSAAARFSLRPDVRVEVRDLREANIMGNIVPLALRVARDILDGTDADATPAVKAKLAVAMVGVGQKIEETRDANEEGLRSLDHMSPAELMDLAARMQSDLKVQANTIEGQAVQVLPPPLLAETDLF